MKDKIQVSVEEIAAILAIWAAALIGCRNGLTANFPDKFSLFSEDVFLSSEVMENFGICLLGFWLSIITIMLFIAYHEEINSCITKLWCWFNIRVEKLLVFLDKHVLKYRMLFFAVGCIFIIIYNDSLSKIFFATILAVFLLVLAYSHEIPFAVRLAAFPALIIVLAPHVLVYFHTAKEGRKYEIETSIEEIGKITATSAKKKGDFAEIRTKDGSYLVNINAITRIREIKESSEGAAKAPPPAEQK